mmetsp:Transcript_845/g.3332  ORF Transcript_845/g.3332 Transcript_845/m.3332 type:complete len:289 (+) Transcript_845:180-1046(+)
MPQRSTSPLGQQARARQDEEGAHREAHRRDHGDHVGHAGALRTEAPLRRRGGAQEVAQEAERPSRRGVARRAGKRRWASHRRVDGEGQKRAEELAAQRAVRHLQNLRRENVANERATWLAEIRAQYEDEVRGRRGRRFDKFLDGTNPIVTQEEFDDIEAFAEALRNLHAVVSARAREVEGASDLLNTISTQLDRAAEVVPLASWAAEFLRTQAPQTPEEIAAGESQGMTLGIGQTGGPEDGRTKRMRNLVQNLPGRGEGQRLPQGYVYSTSAEAKRAQERRRERAEKA